MDNIDIEVKLHPGQAKIWQSERRYLALCAGTGGGKTIFGVWYLARMIDERPGGTFLAISPIYRMLETSLLPTFFKIFNVIVPGAEYNKVEHTWKSPRGTIYFGSADDPSKLEGILADGVWLDEAGQMPIEMWEVAQRRVAFKQGKILLTSTPYKLNWFKSEIYDRWKAGDPDIEVSQYASIVNPYYPREEYERMERTLPRWKFALFCKGEFERPAGLIYDSFNEATCKLNRFPIPKEWPRYVGHDFGGSSPAAMFYAQDPATGYFYAYQEYLPGGRSVSEHVEEFKKITGGVNVIKRAGGSHQEEEIRQGYTAHGWPIQEPKIHSVEEGIARVYALHSLNKLFVFSDLANYLDEKLSYSRKLDDNYKPTDEIENKGRYHLMDCLVAGTLVATKKGLEPIENIKIGEEVLTRQGYFPVIDTIQKLASTVSADFSDGYVLRGTPSHSVFVRGRGFVTLDTLRYCDIIEVWNEKQLSTMELNTIGIQRADSGIESTVKELAQDNVVQCLGVRPSGKALVYDLNVASFHEYYANGILVHNSERYILSDFTPETVIKPGKTEVWTW